MDVFSDSPSLLGMLHPQESELLLKIRQVENRTSDPRPCKNPFYSLSPDKAFTRIVAAQFLTRAESIVREIFIFQQSDDYPESTTEIDPLTNAEIEKRWQSAARAYCAPEASRRIQHRPILLSKQLHPNGWLAPFQALLFCRFKEVYFHPLCPFCGGHLQLCTDDDLLRSHGLAPYGNSLWRHLHCPTCSPPQNGTLFYVLSRSAVQPENVRDFGELRDDLSKLIIRNLDTPPDFPCSRCGEQSNCFGPLNLAQTRIVPFSFYPFFAFLFEADTLHAADFLTLLSGASWESLIQNASARYCPGRVQSLRSAERQLRGSAITLFTAPSERHLLEVFYLKLSFLEQLLDNTADLQPEPMPNDGGNLDHVWVKIPDLQGYLPGLWNFSAHSIGVGLDVVHDETLPAVVPAQRLYQFGMMWFFALLVNSRQNMRTVRSALAKKLAAPQRNPPNGSSADGGPYTTVFAPENILWDPAVLTIPQALRVQWEMALSLGLDLLSSALEPKLARPIDSFRTELKNLKSNVFAALFQSPRPAERTENENLQMAGILRSILADWKRQPPSESGEAATVLLRPTDPFRKAVLDHPAPVPATESVEILPETIQLKAAPPVKPATAIPEKITEAPAFPGRPADVSPPPPQNSVTLPWGGDLVLETVVLRSEPVPPAAGPSAEAPPSDTGMATDIPETVIFSQRPPLQRQPETARGAPPPSGQEAESTAKEHSLLSGRSSAGRSPSDDRGNSESVEETIILRPGKTGKKDT